MVASGVPTIVVSGEQSPDADLMGHSTTPAGVALQSHIYLAQGGVPNLRQLHAFLCDTLLMTGFGFAPPETTPNWGILDRATRDGDGPTIAVLYYRAQHLAGNTRYIEALCQAIEAAGGTPLPIFCASLRTADAGLLDLISTVGRWSQPCWPLAAPRPPRSPPAATTTAGTWPIWRGAGHPDTAGPVPDEFPHALAGQRRRAVTARRRHPGRGAGVRRAHHHGSFFVQGD